MGVKFNTFLIIRHQILTNFFFDLLNFLYIHGQITRETALNYAYNPDVLSRKLR